MKYREISYFEQYFEKAMERIIKSLSVNSCQPKIYGAAVSGGSDSMALSILLNNYCSKNNALLNIYIVDHGLRSESRSEAEYVYETLSKLGLRVTILSWEHGPVPVGKLENMARQARYKLMTQECCKDGVQVLAVGHTLDDQIETYLLRKEKGSKSYGLACMSAVRELNGLKIIRPLLEIYKEDLREYLIYNNIMWVEDPSNESEDFLRVRIRNKLKCNPGLKWTSTTEIKGHTARRIEEDGCFPIFIKRYVSMSFYSAQVAMKAVSQYSPDVLYSFIRRLVWTIGGAQYPCSLDSLRTGLNRGVKFTIGRTCIEFDKEYIIIYREQKNFETKKLDITTKWDNRFLIQTTFENSNFYVSNLKKLDIINLRHIGKLSKEYKIKFLCSLPGIYNEAGELISAPVIGYKADGFVVKFTPPVGINECFVSLGSEG